MRLEFLSASIPKDPILIPGPRYQFQVGFAAPVAQIRGV